MGLGLKGKILIGVMAACLVGGAAAGTAIALTRNGANGSGSSGKFDEAVYLYWGSEQSSTTINNVESLVAFVPQYRGLTVTPKSTKSVVGNVQLTFTLAQRDGNHHIKGLEVEVYRINEAFDAEHAADQIDGLSVAATLDEEHLTGNVNLAVTSSENVHETTGYYSIKITWDGSADLAAGHESYTLDANLTISQSFVPAA